MKVLGVFATTGRNRYGQFNGISNRMFDIERLDEAAIVFMEEQLQMEGTPEIPNSTIGRALIINVIRLES